MIVVIADDFTGASEIGGLGLKYDLTVEIVTSSDITSSADLLIISTDTRSMTEIEAVETIASLSVKLKRLNPDIMFKKIDSVLRGHIVAEIKTQLDHLKLGRALVVPANPAFGRTLAGGRYFVNGKPIHQTSFAHDPEFSVISNKIHNMLRVAADEIHITQPLAKLPASGIIIGECTNATDLVAWAEIPRDNTLLAGSAVFFAEVLKKMRLSKTALKPEHVTPPQQPALFICGSTHNNSRQLIKKAKDAGGPVSYMPEEIVTSENPGEYLFEKWLDEILPLLKIHQKVLIAVNENTTPNLTISAADLRNKKAVIVEKIFQQIGIKELLIEGGSTAAAIINRLNCNRFFPVAEPGHGVIKMKVDAINDLFLTVKPGSYEWPNHTWIF